MTDTPITDAIPVVYPDTPVGSLMRDRDEARASATAAAAQRERFAALADAAATRADSLDVAIRALGGDEPMIPAPAEDTGRPDPVVQFPEDVVEVSDEPATESP